MSNENKLVKMIDHYRSRLAEEQLRLIDAITTNEIQAEDLQSAEAKVQELEKELEGHRETAKTTQSNNHTVDSSN